MSFILSPLSYSFILSLLSDISFIFVSSALICCLLYLTLFFYSVSFCLLSVVSCCLCSFAVSSICFSFAASLFAVVLSSLLSFFLLCVVFVSSLFFLSPVSFCLLHFVLHLHASAAAAAAAAAVAAGVVSVDLTIVGSLP